MKCLLTLVGIPFFKMPCEFFHFRAFQPKKKKKKSFLSLNNPQNNEMNFCENTKSTC